MAGNRRYEDGWISACGQYLGLIWLHPQTDAEQPYEAEVLHRNTTINVIRGSSPQELLDVLRRKYDGAGESRDSARAITPPLPTPAEPLQAQNTKEKLTVAAIRQIAKPTE